MRAHIESVFDRSTRALQSGENQWGGGTFAAALRLNAGQGPADARLIDIDRDGNLDIVFSTSNAANRFGVLRNRGAGVFQAAETSGLAVLPDGTLAFALAAFSYYDWLA